MIPEQGGSNWVVEHWQSVIQHPVFVSLIGSVAAAWYSIPGATKGTKLMNGFLSFVIAIYAGPAIIEYRNIQSKTLGAAIILACAMGGLVVVNAMLEYMRTTKIAQWPVFRQILAPAAQPTQENS